MEFHYTLVDHFSFYNDKTQFYTCRDSAKSLLNENIEQLNFFTEPAQSIHQINQFVEEVTKNNIKNVLQLSPDTTYTNLAIINAVYFKGDWVCNVLFVCEKIHFNWTIFISRCQYLTNIIHIKKFFIRMTEKRLMSI